MSDFTDEYVGLLPRQYWEKTKAAGEIRVKAESWETIFDWLKSFPVEFDIDEAYGDRLDKIGKMVGLPRDPRFTNDSEYRFYLKARIKKNNTAAVMVSENANSIQDAVIYIFNGEAYAVDRQRMYYYLIVDSTYDTDIIQLIHDLDLLPRPAGTFWRYKSYVPENTFGFASNTEAKKFSSRTDPTYDGGLWARRLIIT